MATPAKKPADRKTAKKAAKKPAVSHTGRTTAPKQPKPLEVTPADQWVTVQDGSLLELPSGNVCRAMAPGMDAFLQQGLIPNSLLPIVTRSLQTGEEPNQEEMIAAVSKDMGEEDIITMTAKMIDGVVTYCVLEPVIKPQPMTEDGSRPLLPSERDRSYLYIDQFPLEDKMFIYQWAVGGTRDLERFRREQAASLGPVLPE